MNDEDRVSITGNGVQLLTHHEIEFKHHAQTQAGWTQDWTIRAVGNDLPAMAERIYEAHDILLNGRR